MKRPLIIGFMLLLVVAAGWGLARFIDEPPTEKDKIRIGWQTAWATQGQLVQVLKNTDVLEDHLIRAAYEPASYGGPLNEAALSGNVDVIFTADQPAIILISKSRGEWVIVSRLMYNRVGIYVPPFSEINQLSELRSQTLAVPFGAAAQRFALQELRDAGLTSGTDINVINLGVAEQMSLVDTRQGSAWGGEGNKIAAIATFDPAAATLQTEKKAVPLAIGNVVSVVVMRRGFIEENPEAARRFLAAYTEAWGLYQSDQGQANEWFVDDSNLQFTDEALALAASVEPNLDTAIASERRFNFSASDYEVMSQASQFLADQGLIDEVIDVQEHLDLQFLPEMYR